MQYHFKSEHDLIDLARQLASLLTPSFVIYLIGPLGAGKTTFTRGILRAFGFHDKVKSPTYTLVENYDIHGKPFYHFDLYRIEDPQELAFIGIQDYFHPEAMCIIEWPEKGAPMLPKPDLTCYIDFEGAARSLRLEAGSAKGRSVLEKLTQFPTPESGTEEH